MKLLILGQAALIIMKATGVVPWSWWVIFIPAMLYGLSLIGTLLFTGYVFRKVEKIEKDEHSKYSWEVDRW